MNEKASRRLRRIRLLDARRRETRRGRLALVLALSFFVTPVAASAGQPFDDCDGVDADAVVARVQARYDEVGDIEADFEQTTRSVMMAGGSLEDEQPARGHMQIAKPGRMRWHYRVPQESLVLSDGETLWIHDVGAKEVTRARVTEGFLAGAALQFLLGEGTIAESFEVTLGQCGAAGVELLLTPKRAASYERLEMRVDPDTGIVHGTTIHDLFGNLTKLRFEDVRFDRKPPAGTFVWTPQDGVRVIDVDAAGTSNTPRSEAPEWGAAPVPAP